MAAVTGRRSTPEARPGGAASIKVAMTVSPGEIFQRCFITRVDEVAHFMLRRQGERQ